MSKAESMDQFETTAHANGLERLEGHPEFDLILPQRNWGWFLARGLLLIMLGVLSLLWPGPALVAFAMMFAGFCIADGVLSVASGVRGARDKRERWLSLLLSGMAGIIVGTMFVLFPVLATFTFAVAAVILIAAWAVLTGAFEISAAIRLRKEMKGEWLLAIAGALSVLLGLAIATMAVVTPAISALSVAGVIGAYALIAGTALVVLAFRLRKRPNRNAEIASAAAQTA
jgi:uncharacterized membrane protein HdeD (DUF308 family)